MGKQTIPNLVIAMNLQDITNSYDIMWVSQSMLILYDFKVI